MNLGPEQEASPALSSHTLEISVSHPIYSLCYAALKGLCPSVMEISGHTAGTMAQENCNCFPIVKPWVFFPDSFGQ